MKRSILFIVCNGEPFIGPQLHLSYGAADEIIIVEGPDKSFSKIIKSNRSTDNTIECVKQFPDPDNKIKLIHTNTDKNSMARIGADVCTGEVIYHAGIDELVKTNALNKGFKLLEENKDCNLVKIYQKWYYKWPDTYIMPKRHHCFIRFLRNRSAENITISHVPFGYANAENHKFIGCGNAILLENEWSYHMFAIYRWQLSNKLKYYVKRGDCVKPNTLKNRISEYDSVTRKTIGKPIKTYLNRILTLEEDPINYNELINKYSMSPEKYLKGKL